MNMCGHSFKLLILLIFAPFVASAQVPQLGSTSFENSGALDAQDAFSRGLLLLHSFEYEDSREAFQEARTLDPDFAMAYWGEAMTHNHPIWMRQETEQGRRVLFDLGPDLDARLEKTSTQREKQYLKAINLLYFADGDKKERDVAYQHQMQVIAQAYPDDLDAAAFHALSILGIAHDGRDFALYMRAAAIVEDVFAQNPQHPGAAHYLIHAYDDPIHAPLGLRAARVYAKIAPDATHALHMPSHIFAALGMWPEMASANEDAYAASLEWIKRKGLNTHIHSLHAKQWLAYAYLQLGRFSDATELLSDRIVHLQSHGFDRFSGGYTALMLENYLVETNQWDSEYAHMEWETTNMSPISRATVLFIQGKVALSTGNPEGALEAINQLMTLKEVNEIALLYQHQLNADLLHLEGNLDGAIEVLEVAAKIDADRPLDFGPPEPAKPTYELLGEFYLMANRAEDAIGAYQAALARAPGRSLSFIGLAKAAKLISNEKVYQEAMSKLNENWRDADNSVTHPFLSSMD